MLETCSKFAVKNNFLAPPAFAFRRHAFALAAGLPRQDHVYRTTDGSFRLHNKKFDEMRCKVDSTENERLFENYPNPLQIALTYAYTIVTRHAALEGTTGGTGAEVEEGGGRGGGRETDACSWAVCMALTCWVWFSGRF